MALTIGHTSTRGLYGVRTLVGGYGVAGGELAVAVEAAHERLDHLRVELRAGVLAKLAERVAVGHRLAVRAVARHRVVGVAGENDAAAHGDRVADEPVGVPAAVPALVLVADDPRHAAEPGDRS